MVKEAVGKRPFWKLDCEGAQYVGFRAADWDECPSSKTGTGWGRESNALLIPRLHVNCANMTGVIFD